MNPIDKENYLVRARQSPRLNELFEKFGALADGSAGQPELATVQGDRSLFDGDDLGLQMLDAYEQLTGTFANHALASMPYILEEDCRMAASLLRYGRWLGKNIDDPLKVWAMGAAEGCMARTLATVANGEVLTFSCSPNAENEEQFISCGAPKHATFRTGPFFETSPELLANDERYGRFQGGFDVIFEDTTFQMYGSERREPIKLVRKNLKDTGVMVFFEKMRHEDSSEYVRRELQKDDEFKARFFSAQEIEAKRTNILSTMENGQVLLSELEVVLHNEFAAAVVTWNSGNFYTIMASDSPTNLEAFVASMSAPAIPKEFVHEDLPKRLFGDGAYIFRDSERDLA